VSGLATIAPNIQPTTGGIAGGLDYDSQNMNSLDVNLNRESAMNITSSVDGGILGQGIVSGIESEEFDEPKQNVEEQKLIDDVYDVNAVKLQYELQSLRKNWVLDYMAIMEMRD
jgi:hypothetical protein